MKFSLPAHRSIQHKTMSNVELFVFEVAAGREIQKATEEARAEVRGREREERTHL